MARKIFERSKKYFCADSLGGDTSLYRSLSKSATVTSARPDPIAAETEEALQGFQSPSGDVVSNLWSLIFKEAVYFHKHILYPKFNSVCEKSVKEKQDWAAVI